MPGLLRGVARTAVIAGTATSVSNRVSRRQGRSLGAAGRTAAAAAGARRRRAGRGRRRVDDRSAQGARRAESPGDPHRGGVRRPEGKAALGVTPAPPTGRRQLGDVPLDVAGDRLAAPTAGSPRRPSGSGRAASSGRRAAGRRSPSCTASRSKSSSERRCQASSCVVAAVAGPSPILRDRARAQRFAQEQHVALGVDVLDRRRLLPRSPFLALRHLRPAARPPHSSSSPAGAAPACARRPAACLRGAAPSPPGVGRVGRRRLGTTSAAGDLLRQPLQRQLAVARLAARVLGDRGDHRPELLEQPRPLRLVERLRRLDVEDRFDPRGGDVGVLAARPGGAAGAQLDLAERDREPVVDSQSFGYRESISAASSKSAAVRPPSEWVEMVTVTLSQEISRSGWWPIASAGSTDLGDEVGRADEVAALEALAYRSTVTLPAGMLRQPGLDLGIAQRAIVPMLPQIGLLKL